MRYITFLLVFVTLTGDSWARCHTRYADGILAKALNCNGKSVSIDDIEGAGQAANKVLGVCMDGCYSAMFNADLRKDCDKKYAQALLVGEAAIQTFAKKNRCSFSSSKIREVANSNSDTNGPFSSCFWVSSSIVSPKTSMCGNTPACVGIGYCLEGEYSGEKLRLQCQASGNGKCPSFSVCANAEDPSWLVHDEIEINPDIEVKDKSSSRAIQR